MARVLFSWVAGGVRLRQDERGNEWGGEEWGKRGECERGERKEGGLIDVFVMDLSD